MSQDNNDRNINDKVVDQPVRRRKTTKKGIIVTALIVAAIVGASFIVYLIP